MGAYLSSPKTDKVSTDEINNILAMGASSMQGWRTSQEDAHNSILSFDKDSSFFAVYDGHGGAEVATYCADKLPQFLKELASYKQGKFEQALKDGFLGFDKTLLEPEVVEILKILAGEKNFGDDSDIQEDEDDDEDLVELHEESSLPLDEVLEKYKGHPSMPALKKVKDSASGSSKPQSPYLRGRRAAAVIAEAANKAVMDPDSKPAGSSTSRAAAAALSDNDGPSSSKSSAASKLDCDQQPEEDSTVSSSSSSGGKSSEVTTNGLTPDSSHAKESTEQNGNVTSSEAKTITSTSVKGSVAGSVGDTTVSGSNEAAAEAKQNGNSLSSEKSPANARVSTSSTSKDNKIAKKILTEDDSTDEDGDYDAENSMAENSLPLMYDDDDDEDDDEEDEDADDDDDDEEEENDDEEDEEDEEYEENMIANEQFCANMIDEPGKDSGCTAVVAFLNGRDLYVANAGDSRCVVCRNGHAIDMSLDHKPEDDEESARIIKAGGRVTLDGRVNGGLNLSRAIGDHAYKLNTELPAEEQMISALPDIKKLIIQPEDEFMVLACDGIWNYMSSEEVVDFVRTRLTDENKKISEICEELFDNCLAPNTMGDGTGCDNMTAVIVRFKPKILELSTKLNANECADVLAKQKMEADSVDVSAQKTLKRSASPSADEHNNEVENSSKNKRLKTDDGEVSESIAASSSTNEQTLKVETNECDSVSSEATAAPTVAEVSST